MNCCFLLLKENVTVWKRLQGAWLCQGREIPWFLVFRHQD